MVLWLFNCCWVFLLFNYMVSDNLLVNKSLLWHILNWLILYHHHHHHHQFERYQFPWLSLSLCLCLSIYQTIRLYSLLVLTGPLRNIQSPHKANRCKILLIKYRVSICRGPQQNETYDLVPSSLAMHSKAFLYYLDGMRDRIFVAIQLLFWECYVHVLFKTAYIILVPCLSSFFFNQQVMKLYNSSDTAINWKNFCFILSGRSGFYMINNMSIVVLAFPIPILKIL